MEYYLKNNTGLFVKNNINSCFCVSKQLNNRRMLFGERIPDVPNLNQGSPLFNGYCFLGNLNISNFFGQDDNGNDVLNLFKQVPDSIESDLVKNYSEVNEDLLFLYNEEKTDFFSSLKVKKIEDEEIRLHCFGDIFEFKYHYINYQDLMKVMERCFCRRFPVVKDEKPIMYICLEHFFKDEPEVLNYLQESRRIYENFFNNNNEKTDLCINDHLFDFAKKFLENNDKFKNTFKPSDIECVAENLTRMFCLGCFCENTKPPVSNYALTSIDCKTDSIKILVTNKIVIEKIKEEYNTMGGDNKYGKIEHFLAIHDIIFKKTSKTDANITIVPTKYDQLGGSVLVPSTRYMTMCSVVDLLSLINKFNIKIDSVFNLKNVYNPITIINFKEGETTYRLLDKKNAFNVINYNPIEEEENLDFEFLEI